MEPLFSIVIPTYNRGAMLRYSIQSILSQEFENFEIIVVDDGGTDNSKSIIDSFNDKRIRYFWKENEERSIARNFGVEQAKGDYINFLDSDDYQLPNHLSEAFTIVRKRNPDIIHLGYQLVDKNGNVLMRRDSLSTCKLMPKMLHENILHANAFFIKRSIALEFQFLNSSLAFISEDWALWMRLLVRYKVHFEDTITSVVVEHEGRSLKAIDAGKLVGCTLLIVNQLKGDGKFMSTLGYKANIFFSNQYTFLTLILALSGEKKQTFYYLFKAMNEDITVIFRKRFLASVKHLVKSAINAQN